MEQQMYLMAYQNMVQDGEEVRQIQTKLKRWGYYNGAVDGIYGVKTLEAVKYFQRKNGLKQDGIAGEKTLAAMGIMKSNNNTRNFECYNRCKSACKIGLWRSKGRKLQRASGSCSSCTKQNEELCISQ